MIRYRENDFGDVRSKPLRPHERMALEFLAKAPDRIRTIDSDEVLAAAMIYVDLEKRGLVHIDPEDGMLVTISDTGRHAIDPARHQ